MTKSKSTPNPWTGSHGASGLSLGHLPLAGSGPTLWLPSPPAWERTTEDFAQEQGLGTVEHHGQGEVCAALPASSSAGHECHGAQRELGALSACPPDARDTCAEAAGVGAPGVCTGKCGPPPKLGTCFTSEGLRCDGPGAMLERTQQPAAPARGHPALYRLDPNKKPTMSDTCCLQHLREG